MTDRDVAAEEAANAQRDTERRAEDGDGLTSSAERVVDSILKPLSPDQPDDDELAARREENDAEQRPG